MKIVLHSRFHSFEMASDFLSFLHECFQRMKKEKNESSLRIRGSITAQKGQEFTLLRSPHVHKKGREKFREAPLYSTRFSLELNESFPNPQTKKMVYFFLACLPESIHFPYMLKVVRTTGRPQPPHAL